MRNAPPEQSEHPISNLITNSSFSWTGDDRKSRQEMKVVCVLENVVALLFIISAKNFEQREMMIENNKQKQRW